MLCSITTRTFIFHFLTFVLLCLLSQPGSMLRKRSQADPRDPKQAKSGLMCSLPLSTRETEFLKNATNPRSMTRIRTFKISKHNEKMLSLKKAGRVIFESSKNVNCGPPLICFSIFKSRDYLDIVIKLKGNHRVLIRLVPCEDKEQLKSVLYFRNKVLANKI